MITKKLNLIRKLLIGLIKNKKKVITFFSSRRKMSGIDWFKFTLDQLDGWGVKYHGVKLGKPAYDLFIDDRAINNEEWYKKEDLTI